MSRSIVADTADALVAGVLGGQTQAGVIECPTLFVGVKRFEPGEVFANHFHDGYDEFFAVLTGEIVVWQGRATRVTLRPGSTLLCPRGQHHMLVNETDSPASLLYVKSPLVADDTQWVEWSPDGAA